ncbi:MAG: hypothetical protein B7Y80_18745 [Hyphomicrobium sp. 32-62-53]|nr:MAG: hypothetical protein B7Z29_17440 [Hyphomicrobium sp. 12-62-95]OYX97659.1 MAG: hypothetical protein B7Y80_18745 [Hyphomicrobium sp. 32-62-53]
MGTFHPRRIADVDVLRELDPNNLLTFLKAYAGYLTQRGFSLSTSTERDLDLDQLATLLLQPTDQIDVELVEALVLLHELSTPNRFEKLCQIAHVLNITVQPDSSPADLALAIWLSDPMQLRRMHAETLVLKPKAFHYFQSEQDAEGLFDIPDEARLTDIASQMDVWFNNNMRGTGARVFAFDFPDEAKVYFLIRHGMPFKREGKIENGNSSAVCYRPEFHDVVIYDRIHNELAISNKSQAKGERDMYAAVLGEKLFGHKDYFIARNKFTLEPLRTKGKEALATSDFEGLEDAKLIELQVVHVSKVGDFRTRRSDDIFALLHENREPFPEDGELRGAKLSVTFSGSKRPRMVAIAPPRKANYDRNEDAHLLEAWLRKRGFAIEKQPDEGGEA